MLASKLVDDPYRSVAAEVRERGGFAKESAPFEEFQWADFFRRRIPARLVKKDFDGALRDALTRWWTPSEAGPLPELRVEPGRSIAAPRASTMR